MPAAQTVTVQQIIDVCNYELRNQHKRQYSDAELLVYVSKCLEMIYQALVEERSELIVTSSATFPTVAGQELYDLSAVPPNAGDFWTPFRLWLTGFENSPLLMCLEEERYAYLTSTDTGQPTHFYIEGDNIGLLPFPDAVYTVNMKYFPNFVPPTAGTDEMPYKNMFNLQVQSGVIMLAKNREMMNSSLEVALMEIFQNRAYEITKKRRVKNISVRPRLK